MKSKQLLTSALLALAATALVTSTAKAAGANNDLYLGFTDTGSSNDYVVDIGNVENYIDSGDSFSVNLNADLSSTALFGSGYYTGDPGLSFGLAAFDGSAASPSDAVLSQAAALPAPLTSPSQSSTTGIAGSIALMIKGYNNAAAKGSTPNATYGVFSSLSGVNAVIQPTSEDTTNGHSYKTDAPAVNAFGSGKNITALVDGGTLDLYDYEPGTTPVLAGTGTVSSGGVFTFTAAPEPSTYALMALGVAGVVFLRRRLTV